MVETCKCKENKVYPNFSKGDGLVPAIAQDYKTGRVLMMAYMNEESYNETLKLGYAVYYSRSRQKALAKGRRERQCAEGSRDPNRLRLRYVASQG